MGRDVVALMRRCGKQTPELFSGIADQLFAIASEAGLGGVRLELSQDPEQVISRGWTAWDGSPQALGVTVFGRVLLVDFTIRWNEFGENLAVATWVRALCSRLMALFDCDRVVFVPDSGDWQGETAGGLAESGESLDEICRLLGMEMENTSGLEPRTISFPDQSKL